MTEKHEAQRESLNAFYTGAMATNGGQLVKKQKKKPETTIYIGRSLPGLPQYTVFKHGHMPEHMAMMAKENITIAALIIPISELQESRKNIRTKGHILNTYANQLTTKE